jgi:hypothetical protein
MSSLEFSFLHIDLLCGKSGAIQYLRYPAETILWDVSFAMNDHRHGHP